MRSVRCMTTGERLIFGAEGQRGHVHGGGSAKRGYSASSFIRKVLPVTTPWSKQERTRVLHRGILTDAPMCMNGRSARRATPAEAAGMPMEK